MKIDVQAFINVLPVIGKGLAGVFIVTCAIILAMIILNRLSCNKSKNKNLTE